MRGDVRSGIFRIYDQNQGKGIKGRFELIFISVNIFLFTVMSIGEKNKQKLNAM